MPHYNTALLSKPPTEAEQEQINKHTGDIIRALGFGQMADDVESGRVTAGSTVHAVRKHSHTPKVADQLSRLQELVGPPKLDTAYYLRTGKKKLI